MKKILLFCILAIACLMGWGQQEPLFSQYQSNLFLINPAKAGQDEIHTIRLNYRQQWTRAIQGPQTMIASYHGPVDVKNGVGALVFSDQLGPTQRTGLQLGYAYHLPVGYEGPQGQHKLSMGFAVKMMQYRLALEQIYLPNRNDPAFSQAAASYFTGDLSFGMIFSNDYFFAGFSVPNMIQRGFRTPQLQEAGVLSRLYRHYFALVGYRFVYDQMTIEPSVLVRKIESTPYQIEGNVKFYLAENKLIAGMSFRTSWMATFMVGLQMGNMQVLYSADFMSSSDRVTQQFGPSHEISIGWNLGEAKVPWRKQYYRDGGER
ncbi:MAG: type IX secretion system membrane protein PorP/SprF [Bacteroidota bacterium]